MYAWHLRTQVIRPVLKTLDMWSFGAEDLLMGTAAVETNLGEYLVQLGSGPALGIYQIEPATGMDIITRYLEYRPSISKLVAKAALINPNSAEPLPVMTQEQIEYKLVTDLAFQTAIARIRYWMSPVPLPKDEARNTPGYVVQLGQIWKQIYNTQQGAGTVSKFVGKYSLTGPA